MGSLSKILDLINLSALNIDGTEALLGLALSSHQFSSDRQILDEAGRPEDVLWLCVLICLLDYKMSPH